MKEIFGLGACALVAALMLSSAAHAGPPSSVALVKDIQTGQPTIDSSNPREFVRAGDRVYFAAYDEANGLELWKSDGTQAGTELVKDIFPGGDNVNQSLGRSSSPRNLAAVGSKLFFAAGQGSSIQGIYVSDGTEAGTIPLPMRCDRNGNGDFRDCTAFSLPTSFKDRLYFVGRDYFGKNALWVSDGTPAGTTIFKEDLNSSSGLAPSGLKVVGDQLFFNSSSGLWRTDGTAAGTVKLSSINQFPTTDEIGAFNGKAYFFRRNLSNPDLNGLWQSDGTDAGTVRIKAIDGQDFAVAGGQLFFMRIESGPPQRIRELWKTDGTEAGTVLVKNTSDANGQDDTDGTMYRTEFQGALYFGRFGRGSPSKRRLWKSDGTAAGTVVVKELGAFDGFFSPSFITNVNDQFLVFKDSGLWKSDGTTAGTVQLASMKVSCATSLPNVTGILAVNGIAYFAGDTFGSGGTGCELWKSDGTVAGTVLVKDIARGNGSLPQEFADFNSKALFSARGGIAEEVWKSDATAAGTVKLDNVTQSGAPPLGFTVIGSRAFYSKGGSLFMTDGTTAGTVQVSTRPTFVDQLRNVGGKLLFRASQAFVGSELWTSDGTDAGTQMVKEIRPGGESGVFGLLPVVNGLLYFVGDDGTQEGQGLWRTDGTAAGTFKLLHTFNAPATATAVGNQLYFLRRPSGSFDLEFWKTDGTVAGTVKYATLPEGFDRPQAQMAVLNGVAYLEFDGGQPDVDSELWRTDGTQAGTVLVKDINTLSPFGSQPEQLTTSGELIYFSADDGVHGRELWKTDGTGAGTVLVKDACPGVCSGVPEVKSLARTFYALGEGDIVFSAAGANGGLELWYSDGTEAGTFQVRDINGGAGSSNPQNFLVAGGKLYFQANNGINGPELWAATVPQGPTLVANDDEFVMAEDGGAFNFDPRLNDFDSAQAPIIVTAVTQDTGHANSPGPEHGTVTVQSGGIGITYTPQADFFGSDSFGYSISSGGGRTASARVTVNVTGVNDPPDARDDAFNVQQNSSNKKLAVLGNDNTGNPDGVEVLTITSVTAPDKGGTATISGNQISYTPVTSFLGQEKFSYTIKDAGNLTDSAEVTVNVQEMVVGDTSPNAFSFVDQTGVACNTEVQSSVVTIGGIDTETPVSISGGQYRINGGSYTQAAGLALDGDTVQLKQMSSNLANTASGATLNVGDKSDTFTVTTGTQGCNTGPPGDVTPDAFVFVDVVDVTPNTAITSAPVTIRGINQLTPISVTGGEYSIGSAPFTAAAGAVGNNSQVRVRHTSAAAPGESRDTTLTVGSMADTFTSTTVLDGDRSPNLFTFVDVENAALNTLLTSNEVVISGLGSGISVPLSVTGGSYSKNGGAFTTAAGTIVNGERLRAQHTSSSTGNTAVNTRVSVGQVSDTYTSVTAPPATPPPGGTPPDTTPAPFKFTDVNGVPRNSPVVSDVVTISGLAAATSITVNDGQYQIGGSAFTAATGSIANGQTVRVRHTSAGMLNTATDTTLTVGGVSDIFTSVTESSANSNSQTVADTAGQPVTLTHSAGQLQGFHSAPAPALAPGQFVYPGGFFSFDLTGVPVGSSATLVYTLAPGVNPDAFVKCASSCAEYPATINGNTVTFSLTDGGAGDADGMANGTISDPGAPAVSVSSVSVSGNDADGRAVIVYSNLGSIANFVSVPRPAVATGNFVYPNGFFAFRVTGLVPRSSAVVTMQLPAGAAPATFVVCENNGCGEYLTSVINGDSVSFTLRDGDLGDEDGLANGVITVHGAPARRSAAVSGGGDGGGGPLPSGALLVFAAAALLQRLKGSRILVDRRAGTAGIEIFVRRRH